MDRSHQAVTIARMMFQYSKSLVSANIAEAQPKARASLNSVKNHSKGHFDQTNSKLSLKRVGKLRVDL